MALVRQRMAGAKTFSENVAILFNRGGDLIETGTDDNLKLILLNFMFLTFQDKGTGVFFFINDLKVIIDATIRELNDLPPELEIVSFFLVIFGLSLLFAHHPLFYPRSIASPGVLPCSLFHSSKL